jgi:hypothetical protein
VREELAQALGLPADQAGAAGRELLALLGEIDGLDSALGPAPRLPSAGRQ